MASTAAQLSALASDTSFRARMQSLIAQQAAIIYAEALQTISAISQATPGVITTGSAHGLTVGKTLGIYISGSNSTPSLDGSQSVYVVDATHLKTTVTVSVAGTAAGTFVILPRASFAASILANPAGLAASITATIVNRTNLIAGNTSYDFGVPGHVNTDVTDASILSQLATDWNFLAGI